MTSLKKKNKRKKKDLTIKENKKYRLFEGYQQLPFHFFRFTDVISTWGQRQSRLKRTLEETLKVSIENTVRNKKERKLLMNGKQQEKCQSRKDYGQDSK